MATQPILLLPGKVNSSNALVVNGQAAATAGAVAAIGHLLGDVDSSNRLKVEFVV